MNQHKSRMSKGSCLLILLLAVGGCADPTEEEPRDAGPDVAQQDAAESDGDADGDADGDVDGDVDGDTDADVDSDADGDTPPTVVVGTWNLHNFSVYGVREWRLDDIATKIAELDVDVLAVQELKVEEGTDGEPPQAWDGLLERLPDFDGLHNPWNTRDTTVGLIYRTDTTTVLASDMLFEDESYAFPRPPLVVHVEVVKGSASVELDIVVVHLKAFGDSVDRRRAACAMLDEYLRERPERRYLVIGDYNDDPHDAVEDNAFVGTFLDAEPMYYFVTEVFPPEAVTSLGYYHFVDGRRVTGELLDHVVATGAVVDTFSELIPRIESVPESQYDEYDNDYSDHFPVILTMIP